MEPEDLFHDESTTTWWRGKTFTSALRDTIGYARMIATKRGPRLRITFHDFKEEIEER